MFWDNWVDIKNLLNNCPYRKKKLKPNADHTQKLTQNILYL